MEEAFIEVREILIDDAKTAYIADKGVTPSDVDEVHGFQPRYFEWKPEWAVFDMIGPNRNGRFLIAGIQHIGGHQYRLVTAYWNDDGRARRIYEGNK